MIILGVRNFRVFEILEHLPYTGIFLGLLWGRILAPSQSKNELKNYQKHVVNIIPNSLALQFGSTFMKIRPKIDFYIHTLMHIFLSNYTDQCKYTDIYNGFKSDNLKWRFVLLDRI